MLKPDLNKAVDKIYKLYMDRSYSKSFTLESINNILEIGNEVFMEDNNEEVEKMANRPQTNAPDLMDDEPFGFDRTLEMFNLLEKSYDEVTPELIRKVFELNSKYAWENYRLKYDAYILGMYEDHPNDEYINYLAAIVLYEHKEYDKALACVNKAIAQNASSSHFAHLKGLILMQIGEFETARTYFYQALFLIELLHDQRPRMAGDPVIYPNYPVELQTKPELIRSDLRKIDKVENLFTYEISPLLLY